MSVLKTSKRATASKQIHGVFKESCYIRLSATVVLPDFSCLVIASVCER